MFITYQELIELIKENSIIIKKEREIPPEKELIIEFQNDENFEKDDIFILTPESYEFRSINAILKLNLNEYQTIRSIEFI